MFVKYVCSTCNRSYLSEAEALACEDKHITSHTPEPIGFKRWEYDYGDDEKPDPKTKFPSRILVKMSNGFWQWYSHEDHFKYKEE